MRRSVFGVGLLLVASVASATPVQLQHSGRVLDNDGSPINEEVTLRLALWDAASGGTEVWSEAYTLTPEQGFYAVTLGADTGSNALDHSLLDGARWIQLARVGTDSSVMDLGPRQSLSAVPLAAHAVQAASADYATAAGSADTATSADSATSADYATAAGSADTAVSADSATSADYASSAGMADSATSADYATASGTADSATTADYASAAGTADSATNADYASEAGSADIATTASTAMSADSATYATTAGSATSADTALDADALSGVSLATLQFQDRAMGNLQPNPCFAQGFEGWQIHSGAGSAITDLTSICGTTVYENAPNSSHWIYSAAAHPVDRSAAYEVSGSFRRTDTTGSAGTVFLAVKLYDSSGSNIGGDGTWWYYPVGSQTLTDTDWHTYRATFGAGTQRELPESAAYFGVGAILNYNGQSGGRTYQVTGLGIQRIPNTQTKWVTPTFLNGWVDHASGYAEPGYTQDAAGIVRLRGLIRNGPAGNNSHAFTLPEGMRPQGRRLFPCSTASTDPGVSGAYARCDVLEDGRVLLYGVSSSWVSLDGITFSVD